MKKLLVAGLLTGAIAAFPVFAHHPAADIVDPEVYEMIDGLVADTPHADMTFDDMGNTTTETVVSTRSLRTLENMIDDGLLEYASMLDGEVAVDIAFDPSGEVFLTITQRR